MKPRPFRESEWFKPNARGRYPARMPGMISGVYAIRDAKSQAVLYVGESHTGRLYDTLRRHLATWYDRGGPREFYNRADVEIAWYETPAGEALEHEAWLITHYCPRDNTKGFFDECHNRSTRADELPDWAEAPEEETEWCETCQTTDEVPF